MNCTDGILSQGRYLELENLMCFLILLVLALCLTVFGVLILLFHDFLLENHLDALTRPRYIPKYFAYKARYSLILMILFSKSTDVSRSTNNII